MINKRIMQQHFSLRAETYDAYAAVQLDMARRLIHLITTKHFSSNAPLQILDVGCGTGMLTQLLANAFPQAKITALDIAPGMIAAAQKKIQSSNIVFQCEDIEEATITQQYDLIVSNATFQWLHSVSNTLRKLYHALTPGGLLCFSTFGEETFTELHQSYAKAKQETGMEITHAPGQSFHSLSEMQTICRDALAAQRTMTHSEETIAHEHFSSVRDFLESIKRIGANNTAHTHAVPPSVIRRMMQIYAEEFTENHQVKATYHSLFLSIQKNMDTSGERA